MNIIVASIILIIGWFVFNKFLHIFYYPVKVECSECLNTIKVTPSKAKVTCKYCETEFIYRADGELVLRNKLFNRTTKRSIL